MPNLLISNVDAETLAALKLLAKSNNRSVSGEVRAMIDARLNDADSVNASEKTDPKLAVKQWRQKLKGRNMTPTYEILDEIAAEEDARAERLYGFHEGPQSDTGHGGGHEEKHNLRSGRFRRREVVRRR